MKNDPTKLQMSPVSSWTESRLRWFLLLWIFWRVPDGSAAEAEARELRLGYFPNLTHAQALYVRASSKFESQIGVRVKWTAFNAGPTAIESLFTDAVDATFVGPGPTINGYLKSKGAKFVIVAGSACGGAGLVVRPGSGISSERDFGGKVIATPQLGNTQDIAARTWFTEKGYQRREQGGNLTLIPLSNPDQLTMFKKRQIDGAWTIEPWMARLEIEGGGELFLEEKSLWPEGRYVTTHLVVSKSYLVKNRRVIHDLLAALIEVTGRINLDKTAAGLVLNAQLKKETGKVLKDEVIERAMSRVEFTWDPICASLQRSAEAAHRIGFIRQTPALGGIYSLHCLNTVLEEKGMPPVPGPSH